MPFSSTPFTSCPFKFPIEINSTTAITRKLRKKKKAEYILNLFFNTFGNNGQRYKSYSSKVKIMPTIQTVYRGELRTQLTHVASGQQIFTDAPLDNQGKGEAISPTDMLSASLGSCMLTIMGIAARTHGINLEGVELAITKHMVAPPRKVGKIEIIFSNLPKNLDQHQKLLIEKAAKTCPVALSLHPQLEQIVQFNW